MPRVPESFYEPDGDHYVATELTRGPWDPGAQHAGPPAALIGREIERLGGGRMGGGDDPQRRSDADRAAAARPDRLAVLAPAIGGIASGERRPNLVSTEIGVDFAQQLADTHTAALPDGHEPQGPARGASISRQALGRSTRAPTLCPVTNATVGLSFPAALTLNTFFPNSVGEPRRRFRRGRRDRDDRPHRRQAALAEGEGFEPPDRRTRSTAFKAAAINQTLPPLRVRQGYLGCTHA